jgi:hypothetical protein
MQRTFFRHPGLAGALRNHAPQRSTESPPKVFSVENSFGCLAQSQPEVYKHSTGWPALLILRALPTWGILSGNGVHKSR